MTTNCLDHHDNFNEMSGKLIHLCSKGSFMIRAKEVKTICAYNSVGTSPLNDLVATFMTLFTRYVLDFIPPANAPSAT